jgi:23S rRNA (guanine2445-N2)-methyltransferase / 23S rRNA (guanine2069-N7)-methyltransferase
MAMNDNEQTAMLANRLRKNDRKLRAWRKREAVNCYRIYDRDIPELPFAIDRYGDALVIAEYARRREEEERGASGHAEWLEAMVAAAGDALNVSPDQRFLKRRQRQRGEAQYERNERRGVESVVTEGGLNFLVNLSDYLDVGLFLDHRPARGWVREMAEGARLLNLFAYTGSFSVYAASVGAHTTTVDLSNTYLDWAKQNMALNGIDDNEHSFVHTDARRFLERAKSRDPYDIIVLDPPTFSTSSGMTGTFDVQRDHVQLIDAARACLVRGGLLYFSTNLRTFKLAEQAGEGFRVEDRSDASIPIDFRNRRIHKLWRMEKL